MRTRSLSDRWNRLRTELTLNDLLVDVSGKFLLGLGLGALFVRYLQPYAWVLIGVGLGLSVTVKAKYWKRFWGNP